MCVVVNCVAVEPYLPEPFSPKPSPVRQTILPLPGPPGHRPPAMLMDSMPWPGPGRPMAPQPPPFIGSTQPGPPVMMSSFDGTRGAYGGEVMSAVRSANLIVVPTRAEEQQNTGRFVDFFLILVTHCGVRHTPHSPGGVVLTVM